MTVAGKPMSLAIRLRSPFSPMPLHGRTSRAISATGGVDSIVESFEPWLARHQLHSSPPRPAEGRHAGGQQGPEENQEIHGMMPDQRSGPPSSAAFDMYDAMLTKPQPNHSFRRGRECRRQRQSRRSIAYALVMGGKSGRLALGELKPGSKTRFTGLRADPSCSPASSWFRRSGPIPWHRCSAAISTDSSGPDRSQPGTAREVSGAYASTMKDIRSSSWLSALARAGGKRFYDGTIVVTKS